MKVSINLKKRHLSILIVLIVLILVSFAIADYQEWNTRGKPQSHDTLYMKNIYAKNQDDINVKSNLIVDAENDIKINGNSVVTNIIGENGISVTGSGNSRTISSSGTGISGYEVIRKICGSSTSCFASCSSGKKVISGSCSYDGARSWFEKTAPSDDNNKWECRISANRVIKVVAICASV